MRILLLAAVLPLTIAPATHGQSCPAADSVLGVVAKFDSPKTKYDKFADSTMILGAPMFEVPFNGPSATAMVTTAWAGRAPTDTASTFVSVEFEESGSGGAIVGGKTGDNPLSVTMAKYGEVKDVKFLLDDSVRIALPLTSNKASIKKAGVISPEKLVETLTFVIPADVRGRIVGTHEGRMRLGDYEIGVGKKTVNSLRDVHRFLICSKPASPTSSQ